MRIGVFDSGLGGLAIARAIMRRLPEYDYLYLGDTKRLPYGNRSHQTVYEFTAQALDFLFSRDCQLIVVACNTASAESLRRSQREYLPRHYPDRRVLGVIIPTAEAAVELGIKKLGVLATSSTVESGAFVRELERQMPGVEVVQRAAPLLVPLLENGGVKYLDPILDDYLADLGGVGCVVLGCTHYCLIKEQVRHKVGVPVISQDEVVPDKLADYLARHSEIESRLGKHGRRRYYVTDLTRSYADFAETLAGEALPLEVVAL